MCIRDRYKVPRMIFANKMDRVGADFTRCMTMIKDRLSKRAFALQLPVGSGELFTGHIDVIERKQYIFDEASLGKTFEVVDVPAEYKEACEACLLYTSPSPRDRQKSRMPSSA